MFSANLGWLNTLSPDFHVIVGDHTPGYTDQPKQTEFWNGFEDTANKLKSPYVMVPGNHDIYDAASEALWWKRYGSPWFSWEHKGCHFVALDCIEVGKEGSIREKQLEWLKKNLAGAKNAHATFVFVHWPLWLPDYKNQEWDADVHPLLAAAGADFVFCGHEHHYEVDEPKDGVQYVMLGPSAANTGDSFGSFTNALLVEVKGGAASYRLLTPEGEKRTEFFTREVAVKAGKPLELEPVDKIGKNRPLELVVAVANPWKDRPIQAIVALSPGAGSWKGARVERTIGAGKRERIAVRTRTGGTVMPLPTVSLEIRCEGELVARKEALPLITAPIPGLAERVVDDFEDGDDVNLCVKNGISLRGGRWTVSVDKTGTSKMELKFAEGVLHVFGVQGPDKPPIWTYTNFRTLLANDEALNITGSTGISFRARSDRPVRWEAAVDAIVGGKDLVRTGGVHRVEFEPERDWKDYRFFWHEFTQPGWVLPDNRVGPLTVESVKALSWNPPQDGEFDLMLDDVKLIYE